MKIGVLAIQGDFDLHQRSLTSLGVQTVQVRRAAELNGLDGMILPGGESTTFHKLLTETDMGPALLDRLRSGLPVWGTCAGAIILGRGTERPQPRWELIDLEVFRNAYGRQVDSFVAPLKFGGLKPDFPGVFIRAPRFFRAGNRVTILAEVHGQPVAARQAHILVTSFHPELTNDTRIHHYFVNQVIKIAG